MKNKLEVGQKLFCRTGNELRPVIVKKSGPKYFTAGEEGKDWADTVYHTGTWCEKTEYAPRNRLYETEQEFLDEQESIHLYAMIRGYFQSYTAKKLPLQTLREIDKLLAAVPA